MSKRPRRNCVFCNGTAGSREHALPDWLAKAMERENEPVLPAILNSNLGWETQGDYRATGNLITKRVCGDCNGGWMCELESSVKNIIGDWVNPGRENLDKESLAVDKDQLAILNRWLIKTAICLSHVAPRGESEKLPNEAPAWSFNNHVPPSCLVYAAWIKEPAFMMKVARGFRIFNGGKFFENQIHRHSFDFSIQLNHLAIRIVNAPDADWMVMTCRNSRGNLCTPRFWSHGIQPPEIKNDIVVFDGFEHFTKVCTVTTSPTPSIHPDEAEKASRSLQSIIP